ncbi:hypothetical protein ACRRTK_017375 [Alexandromys fortis]
MATVVVVCASAHTATVVVVCAGAHMATVVVVCAGAHMATVVVVCTGAHMATVVVVCAGAHVATVVVVCAGAHMATVVVVCAGIFHNNEKSSQYVFIFLLMLINETLVPVVKLQGPITADENLSKTARTPLFISAETPAQLYVCHKTIFGNFISNKGLCSCDGVREESLDKFGLGQIESMEDPEIEPSLSFLNYQDHLVNPRLLHVAKMKKEECDLTSLRVTGRVFGCTDSAMQAGPGHPPIIAQVQDAVLGARAPSLYIQMDPFLPQPSLLVSTHCGMCCDTVVTPVSTECANRSYGEHIWSKSIQFNVRAWEKEMFALYSTCYGRNSTLAKSEQEEYQLQGGEEPDLCATPLVSYPRLSELELSHQHCFTKFSELICKTNLGGFESSLDSQLDESSLWRDNPVEIQCALILGCGSRHVVLPFKRHLICERPILEVRWHVDWWDTSHEHAEVYLFIYANYDLSQQQKQCVRHIEDIPKHLVIDTYLSDRCVPSKPSCRNGAPLWPGTSQHYEFSINLYIKSLDAFLVKETEELLTSFVWYKEETGGRQGPYHLVPVLCPDSSRVLNKLRNVKISLAGEHILTGKYLLILSILAPGTQWLLSVWLIRHTKTDGEASWKSHCFQIKGGRVNGYGERFTTGRDFGAYVIQLTTAPLTQACSLLRRTYNNVSTYGDTGKCVKNRTLGFKISVSNVHSYRDGPNGSEAPGLGPVPGHPHCLRMSTRALDISAGPDCECLSLTACMLPEILTLAAAQAQSKEPECKEQFY